jgi:hypothetical protein
VIHVDETSGNINGAAVTAPRTPHEPLLLPKNQRIVVTGRQSPRTVVT